MRQAEFAAYNVSGAVLALSLTVVLGGYATWRDVRLVCLVAMAAPVFAWWMRRRRSGMAAVLLMAVNVFGWLAFVNFSVRPSTAVLAVLLTIPFARAWHALQTSSLD